MTDLLDNAAGFVWRTGRLLDGAGSPAGSLAATGARCWPPWPPTRTPTGASATPSIWAELEASSKRPLPWALAIHGHVGLAQDGVDLGGLADGDADAGPERRSRAGRPGDGGGEWA